MSKGSALRPSQVSKEELANNWKNTFGKKEDTGANKLPLNTPIYDADLIASVAATINSMAGIKNHFSVIKPKVNDTITKAMPTCVEIHYMLGENGVPVKKELFVYCDKTEITQSLVNTRELTEDEKAFFSK